MNEEQKNPNPNEQINNSEKSDKIEKKDLFDFQGLIKGIKSIITPPGTPEPITGDQLGEKMAQISHLVRNLSKQHAQMAENYIEANRLVNELYEDLQTFRNQAAVHGVTEAETDVTIQTTMHATHTATPEFEPEISMTPGEQQAKAEKIEQQQQAKRKSGTGKHKQ